MALTINIEDLLNKQVLVIWCPAGLDPASHPVKPVGTQRVALEIV